MTWTSLVGVSRFVQLVSDLGENHSAEGMTVKRMKDRIFP